MFWRDAQNHPGDAGTTTNNENFMTSEVKCWDERKGFGFIVNPNGSGNDFFVHHSSILGRSGRKNLRDGQKVEFEVEDNEKGMRAVNVIQI